MFLYFLNGKECEGRRFEIIGCDSLKIFFENDLSVSKFWKLLLSDRYRLR